VRQSAESLSRPGSVSRRSSWLPPAALTTHLFIDEREEVRLREWAAAHDIDLGYTTFVLGPSDESLRVLPPDPVDLFMIDGGHGYPLPQLDWFYGAGRLKAGGILVLDDIHLWARGSSTHSCASTSDGNSWRAPSTGPRTGDWSTARSARTSTRSPSCRRRRDRTRRT
jgi:hypothetical protein